MQNPSDVGSSIPQIESEDRLMRLREYTTEPQNSARRVFKADNQNMKQ